MSRVVKCNGGNLVARLPSLHNVHDRRSYVAVSRRLIGAAVASLNKGRIKGQRFRATHVGGDGRR